MIVAKSIGDFKIQRVVEPTARTNSFSSSNSYTQKQPSFETVLTTLLYAVEESKEAPIGSGSASYESYNSKAISFYSAPRHLTDFRC